MTANSLPSEQERAPDYPNFLQEWVSEENEDYHNTFAGEQVDNNYGDGLQTQYILPVESLEVGQSITVVFRNPDSG
ncbi:hypothetical protein GBAR_LOCUS27545, partial [Geodia barretti]